MIAKEIILINQILNFILNHTVNLFCYIIGDKLSICFSFQEKNKEDLFIFLADGVPQTEVPEGKLLIATKKDKIVSSSELPRTHRLSPCSHEEADTRGPAHLQDIVLHDHSVISMRTVDTDWIVIALAQFHSLTPELEELYVEFGSGKNYRQVYILCKTINGTQSLLSDLDFNTL